MKKSDLDYNVPESLIAYQPTQNRPDSRLMVLDSEGKIKTHSQFKNIIDHLPKKSLLVFNNTRVMSCRLFAHKPTGAKIEIFLLREEGPQRWRALTRCSAKLKAGAIIELDDQNTSLEIEAVHIDGERSLVFPVGCDVHSLMDRHGHTPLPPYIKREDELSDKNRYQTVYAQEAGAVAAPTAGLHFDNDLLTELRRQGIGHAQLTLHVGIGTFRPIKSDEIEDHHMHPESYSLNEENAALIQHAQEEGRAIIAVGTTSIRALESIHQKHGKIIADTGDTEIYLYPPYKIKSCDGLITNFHLPESTLMLLVSCFIGLPALQAAYREAVEEKYRFYSFGDSMFISPAQ